MTNKEIKTWQIGIFLLVLYQVIRIFMIFSINSFVVMMMEILLCINMVFLLIILSKYKKLNIYLQNINDLDKNSKDFRESYKNVDIYIIVFILFEVFNISLFISTPLIPISLYCSICLNMMFLLFFMKTFYDIRFKFYELEDEKI